jgi:hypothetical protein
MRCPSEKKRSQFLSRLENLGLYSELKNLAKSSDKGIHKQLMNMQINTRQVFPTMQYQIDVHKNKAKQLLAHVDELEKKIEVFQE